MPEIERDELFPRVKVAVRSTINDPELDQELDDLILAARNDLTLNGLVSSEFADANPALMRQAIILYVKGHWGYDNPDAQKFVDTYEDLKKSMSLHSQYDQGDADEV